MEEEKNKVVLKFCKRKIFIFILIFLAVISPLNFSCSSLTKQNFIESVKSSLTDFDVQNNFSAVFLDVGEGDCTFIRFPDGKNMLIDCGSSIDDKKDIEQIFKGYNISEIDFLILSSPYAEKLGCANYIISKYTVKKAYLQKVINRTHFSEFDEIISILDEKGASVTYPKKYERYIGEDYCFAFLTPDDSGIGNLNQSANPTIEDVDNASFVIYLKYKDTRFLFNTNTRISVENNIVTDNNFYISAFNMLGIDYNIENIDFYKVSKNGDRLANGENLLNLIASKNAIISSGTANNFSHPNTEVLSRLVNSNSDMRILRTDTIGSIFVGVKSNGGYIIKTQV